jgi:ABC-2 type transport system ATP-binding protein
VVEFTVDRGPAAAADALRRIDAANITLAGLTIREPSLDDVFLNLTGHKAEEAGPSDDEMSARPSRKASS